jgi:hypothetical protein
MVPRSQHEDGRLPTVEEAMNFGNDRVSGNRQNSAEAKLMPTPLYRRKVDFETRALRGMLAAAGCLIVASALFGNAGSALLSLAACLACLSRIERNYRHGAYGRVKAETIE